MFVYRFKVNFEEQDGFSREIELGVNQTFLDFYNIIAGNLSLDKSTPTAFYLCDHRYRKKQPIYHPEHLPASSQQDTEVKPLVMDSCELNEFIDDPHQKFLMIYDLKADWTFYIELMKIAPTKQTDDLPRIASSVGGVPVEISRRPKPMPGMDDDEDEDMEDIDEDIEQPGAIYSEDELDELDDSEFYSNSIEENSQDFDEGKL